MFRVRNLAELLRYIAHATRRKTPVARLLNQERRCDLKSSGHRAARQETSRVLFRFHDSILGSGFSGSEDALFDHHNTATRSASEARQLGVYTGCILPMQRMSWGRARVPSSFP